jgi:hypothetical protein
MGMSKKLQDYIRRAGIPRYRIAKLAGMSPGMLYKYTAGIEVPRKGNKGIIEIGKILGLNEEECFSDDTQ